MKVTLESALAAYAGKPVGVLIRTDAEMAAILEANPFASEAPNRTVAIFLDDPPPADALAAVTGCREERDRPWRPRDLRQLRRGDGRLEARIPAAKSGTARNINTIAKLAQWSAAQIQT